MTYTVWSKVNKQIKLNLGYSLIIMNVQIKGENV